MISEEYRNFINEKVLEYLPTNKTKIGNVYVCRCPICGDSKKNLQKKRGVYYLQSASYHCFNCGESMSGYKLLQFLSGNAFDDIKTEFRLMKIKSGDYSTFSSLRSDTNLSCSNVGMIKLQQLVKKDWKKPLSDKAKAYLENRKVLSAPFLKGKLFSTYDSHGNEFILIPWTLNGIEAYYQINDFQKIDRFGRKYIFPKNHDKIVYGLDNIDLSWPYIICFEGVYYSLFVKNGIALGGKNLTPMQLNIIKTRYPKHQIVLSFDNDKPGLEAMMKMIKNNVSEFKYFRWFENTSKKDINDFILEKNDVNYFKNSNRLNRMIISSIEMKMHLIESGIWNNK